MQDDNVNMNNMKKTVVTACIRTQPDAQRTHTPRPCREQPEKNLLYTRALRPAYEQKRPYFHGLDRFYTYCDEDLSKSRTLLRYRVHFLRHARQICRTQEFTDEAQNGEAGDFPSHPQEGARAHHIFSEVPVFCHAARRFLPADV